MRPVHVYFVQEGTDGPIKIGMSLSPTRRRAGMQTSNPRSLTLLRSVPCEYGVEDRLHVLFEGDRIRGEWYRPSPALLAMARGESPVPGEIAFDATPSAVELRPSARKKAPPALFAMKMLHPDAWEITIRHAMRASSGRVDVAAKALGISTRHLFRLLEGPTFEDVVRASMGARGPREVAEDPAHRAAIVQTAARVRWSGRP